MFSELSGRSDRGVACSLLKQEVCNRGVACSLLKLGSLEKTIIASPFHSGLHSGTIFLWKKRCHFREQKYM